MFAMAYNAETSSLLLDFGVQYPCFQGGEIGETPNRYEDVCCLALPAETAKNLAELIGKALASEANNV